MASKLPCDGLHLIQQGSWMPWIQLHCSSFSRILQDVRRFDDPGPAVATIAAAPPVSVTRPAAVPAVPQSTEGLENSREMRNESAKVRHL